MLNKGFGQTGSAKIDELIKRVVRHCKERHPEALDEIFDNLPALEYQHLSKQFLEDVSAFLHQDVDTKAWLCGYMASEINRSEDNHRPFHPITKLAKILIEAGMEPFTDFTPYPGCRLVIANTTKFESLPPSVKAVVQQVFDMVETQDTQMQQMNDALLAEMVVD